MLFTLRLAIVTGIQHDLGEHQKVARVLMGKLLQRAAKRQHLRHAGCADGQILVPVVQEANAMIHADGTVNLGDFVNDDA